MESVKRMPRVLLAGANSGCGKTSITCGILKALVNRGLHIQSYKCGPDYIDPMLHSHITGRDCRNLDPFFSTGQDLRYLVGKDSQDVDFSVTEGVMGYYDGVAFIVDLDVTGPVFENIVIKSTVKKEELLPFDVLVYQESVQAEGFVSPEEAFETL